MKTCIVILFAFAILLTAFGAGMTPGEVEAQAAATPAPSTASPTPTVLPPLSGSGGGVIAFVSDREGSQDIYLMNADGSDQRQLTNWSGNEGWISWSPDGAQMVCHAIASGGSNLKILDVLTGEVLSLRIQQGGYKFEPAWSHDGTRIAFSIQSLNGSGSIYLVDPSGENLLRLTDTPRSIDGGPVWSPDDSKIAFYSKRDGNFDVYVMNADGSDLLRLTDDDAMDIVSDWSPDGTQISFASNRDGNYELYVMDADGANPLRLTDNPGDDMYPVWSPDGTRIAYSSGNRTQTDIFVMNADGTNLQQLTDSPGQNFAPVWRP